jgi:hypothetical protein
VLLLRSSKKIKRPPARLIRDSLRIRQMDKNSKFAEFSTRRLSKSAEFDENVRVAGSAGPPKDAVITSSGEYMTPRPRSARPK